MKRRKGTEFERGFCENCGGPYIRKPRNKRFCKATCRYRRASQKRIGLTEDQMMTVGQAAISLGKTYEQVRRMIRRDEIRARRFFGRILVHTADVEGR